MNYEALLDEIMVNTLSAKERLGLPQKSFKYAVCPWQLEFHTTIFLTSALLSLDQSKPLLILIQVEDAEAECLEYIGSIGPHFGRIWKRSAEMSVFPQTVHNYYPYLDKLFSYLAVINTHQSHQVFFVNKGAKLQNLITMVAPLLQEEYSLLIVSDLYADLSTQESKTLSKSFIAALQNRQQPLLAEHEYPALALLHYLISPPSRKDAKMQLVNTGELGLDSEKSSSLWFMLA